MLLSDATIELSLKIVPAQGRVGTSKNPFEALLCLYNSHTVGFGGHFANEIQSLGRPLPPRQKLISLLEPRTSLL